MRTLHVATTGSDTAPGTPAEPLRTINRAATLAMPGDTVVVHEGEYREWVRPQRGGLSDTQRITYAAAEGEKAVIKGSERVTQWTHVHGTVWEASVDNSLFGSFNPFAEEVDGDWIVYGEHDPHRHLGEVYLNGKSLYEVGDTAEVDDPTPRQTAYESWTGVEDRIRDTPQTLFTWTARVDDATTTIRANFHGADPREELVEINVRRSVFYPERSHLDYITVRGFELAQSASPWAPPTADQPGLIGPHWARGWIIEDNVIHDAKCAAISLGKDATTGHNFATERGDRPGYQYQLESVFTALALGWSRDTIGSHIVRRNTIFDCGQNAIVGHLGAIFSRIEDNHIYNIGIKYEFYGHEIAGIKLHAAIDTVIEHNRIHACRLGVWLDWQTQGTRVSRNLVYDNRRDLFVEVSHGPYIIDHNVFGSPASIEIVSQGGAYINNLIRGAIRLGPERDRATPYHLPHSTQVAGVAVVYSGDDRFIGNVFLSDDTEQSWGPTAEGAGPNGFGTAIYAAHPPTFEAYLDRVAEQPPGTHRRWIGVHQPVYISRNVYGDRALPHPDEHEPAVLAGRSRLDIVDDGDTVHLDIDLPPEFDRAKAGPVRGSTLPSARLAAADFEDADGTSAVIDTDLLGERASSPHAPGPIHTLGSGKSRVRVW